MKNDALNRFKEEMNRRGLIRKIQVCANLIPPPAWCCPGIPDPASPERRKDGDCQLCRQPR